MPTPRAQPAPLARRLARLARRALATVATLWLAAHFVACGIQRSLLFPAPRGARTPALEGATLLRIPGPAGSTVFALYAAAPPGAPTIVHFHGNGEQLADNEGLVATLRAQRLGVLAVEYPGYGLAASGQATEANLYAAADAALAYLHGPLGVPAARVVLEGHSLGTGVASEMALRGHGARLVLLSPYTSITEMASRVVPFVTASLVVRDRFETARKAPNIHIPVLIVHGTDDEVVPVAMGRELATLFPDARLDVIPGAHHGDLFFRWGDRVVPEVARFARGAP